MRAIENREQRSIFDDSQKWRSTMVRFRNIYDAAGSLRKMVNRFGTDMSIRQLTLKIIKAECESRDERCQALAVARWVQERIYYVHEGRETFQLPTTTVKTGAGDCDDHTTLMASMLMTIGIRAKLCLVNVEGKWVHIFPIAIIRTPDGPHRLTLDSTLIEPVDDMVNPLAKLAAKRLRVRVLLV
jgi:hypothetical protein